tara:strand:+ start:385 stop:510 length:126 start_codon:yes stop_codon:yes gene_type:complete
MLKPVKLHKDEIQNEQESGDKPKYLESYSKPLVVEALSPQI